MIDMTTERARKINGAMKDKTVLRVESFANGASVPPTLILQLSGGTQVVVDVTSVKINGVSP